MATILNAKMQAATKDQKVIAICFGMLDAIQVQVPGSTSNNRCENNFSSVGIPT